MNNQGDKEDAFDNLDVEFDKIKFAMLEYQHGVNYLQLADMDGCLILTFVSWFPDFQRGLLAISQLQLIIFGHCINCASLFLF
jgi:hypothetical protein